MSIRNARKIRAEELSDRRRQAVALFESGMKRKDIAPIVGAHRNVVGQWIKSWQETGEQSFLVDQPGRPAGTGRKLEDDQSQLIQDLVANNTPDHFGYPFLLWSREAIQTLILDKIGIDLPIRTLGTYLERWGFTAQKPKSRAYEQSDKAVQKWLNEDYPEIASRAKKEGAEIHWGDETGIRSDDVKGRSYAPKGKTPVIKLKGKRERLNMLSTVTNRGKLRFTLFSKAMNAEILITFLTRLIKQSDKKVFLILDNLPVHHCDIVKQFIKANIDDIEMFFLPSYSPELNPDEYLNSEFKKSVRKLPDTRKKGQLEKNVRSVLHQIQKQPERVIKCFHSPYVRYAV